MALKTPPALVRAVLLPVLTVTLAACGGGSTAGPIAATSDAPPPSSPSPSPTTTTAAAPSPATTAATPAPRPTTSAASPSGAGGSRTPGGAAAPSDSAPADAPAAPEATRTTPVRPAGSPLDERANLMLTRRVSPAHYFQQGTVAGTYDGTMEVEARITSRGVLVRFTATLPGGTISGRGVAVAILDSTTWPSLRGTAIVTGGTGRFAGIHGRRLKVSGRAKPDASHAHVRLSGTVVY